MNTRQGIARYENELLEQAFSHLPAALLTSMVISLILAVVLWPVTRHPAVLIWLSAAWLVSGSRFGLAHYFRRREITRNSLRPWNTAFMAGVTLSGIVWGVSGVLFFSEGLPQYNVFVAFSLGGMTAGAASSLASLPHAMRLFTALELTPIVVRFLSTGDEIHVAMGVMIFIYGAAYLVISSQSYRTLLTSLRLRHENIIEIAERKNAENELRRHKEELEEVIRQRTEQLENINRELLSEISDRRVAEERLRVSEERFRDLVETSSDWIWEVDPEGVYTYVSPKVEALLGYKPEEILRKTPFDLMPHEEQKRIRELFQDIARRGEPFSGLENKNLHKDGHVVILETSGEPIKDSSGNLLGYRGIDRDITERKRMESEVQRIRNLESLGMLAGGIAHDFNNLLSAIFGNIDLARHSSTTDSEPFRLLSNAADAIDKARRLTAQLLTFSRGGVPVKKIVSMRNLILDASRFVLSGSSIQCEYALAEDLWNVDADEGQIWQVLQNLLVNASDAMPLGGTVTISAENYSAERESDLAEKHGSYVKIAVHDNGSGIDEDCLPRVFDPYFSTREKSGERGRGLGLTICHSIIKKHDGHIFLESQPGKGTTASFFLPASTQESQPIVPVIENPAPSSTERRRILLLEDEEIVRGVTVRMIDHLGYDCASATDGEKAIELYNLARSAGNPFDLVILDLTIRGGMGGEETMRQLMRIDPHVKAIIASGYADSEIIASYRNYGFLSAIVKPYNLDSLRKLLHQFV